ncbi:Squamosa promoter-binding-like protein [Musa troglodytarum]|uniref:Squamosa promoter-binding-like protein n=1 Tax=Musa troglodytarum TaxID=320322 RepID=A0A9E7EGE5_9LILI|nr:Squamosa promoter-binding-like protein [Musa troglodytarum]
MEAPGPVSALLWGGLLDFAIDDEENDTLFPAWEFGASDLPTPSPLPVTVPAPILPSPCAEAGEGSEPVGKRDPRLLCSNFLEGRVPCSCPAADEVAPAEWGDEPIVGAVGGDWKRVRKARATPVAALRCQVPGCEADIGELKGYHRRHRVCLRCACAPCVVLDGRSKRYCQQCGKFHMLSDFDEGKRSCRRKLERHNKRRRRRHTDGVSMLGKEKDPHGGLQMNDSCVDKSMTEMLFGVACHTEKKVVSNKLMEGKVLHESDDGCDTKFNLLSGFTTIRGNSFLSFAASSEPQNEEKDDNPKSPISSTLCNNKSTYVPQVVYHSSFMIGILQSFLDNFDTNMPVELEGYIRPGCTFMTIFIAMPDFMWEKLSQDVAGCIENLIYAPESLLVRRGNIHIYLCDTIVQILKDQKPLMSTRTEVQVPRFHYVYPTFFEAGRQVQFIACGTNLNRAKLRFLVSFAGKYLELSSCLAISHGVTKPCNINDTDHICDDEHEMFQINIPQTDSDVFGPAFLELICSEFERISRTNFDSCCSDGIYGTSSIDATSYSGNSFVSKQIGIPALLLDIAWVLQEPAWVLQEPGLEKIELPSSTNIHRLVNLLKFLLQIESLILMEVVLHYVDGINWLSLHEVNNALDGDWLLFLNYINQAREILSQGTTQHMRSESGSRNLSPCPHFSQSSGENDAKDSLLSANQEFVREEEGVELRRSPSNQENHEAIPLVAVEREHPSICCQLQIDDRWKKGSWGSTLFRKASVHVSLAVGVGAIICFVACLNLFHSQKAGGIAVYP